jgi:hypothetical protein
MADQRVYSGYPTTPVPRDETPTSGVRAPVASPPPPIVSVQALADEVRGLRRGLYLLAVMFCFELGLVLWMLRR